MPLYLLNFPFVLAWRCRISAFNYNSIDNSQSANSFCFSFLKQIAERRLNKYIFLLQFNCDFSYIYYHKISSYAIVVRGLIILSLHLHGDSKWEWVYSTHLSEINLRTKNLFSIGSKPEIVSVAGCRIY